MRWWRPGRGMRMPEDEDGDGDSGEDQLDAQPFYPSKGPDREGMASDYLPGEDQWLAKTRLDLNDPHAVAALRQMDEMYPEVEDLQPMINGFVDDFLVGRTSVNAAGREDYRTILINMFGGSTQEQMAERWGQLLGADED
jgi:hypothetical protein